MNLLVVDDDDRLRERLAVAFRERDYTVFTASDHGSAVATARAHALDRAVVDLRMPGPHGIVVVKDLRELHPAIEIVVVTGYSSIATAVEAVRLGARNYLTKPAHVDQILAAFEHTPAAGAPLEYEIPTLARLEHEHIERVLRECNGNVSKAARALGLNRRTLQYKLAKFPVRR